MFDAVEQNLAEGVSELELVAAAEEVSRRAGFGGNIQMRRYPLQCDRGVIVSGRAGGIPSFFDSAVGGSGPHPLAGMGSGFNKVRANEPILVDLVHVHRGYVVDKTRMFSVGKLSQVWHDRLEHMLDVSDVVVTSLANGDDCSMAWQKGSELAYQLGYEENLMGMKPDQSKFLGHSVGLQLDESPVVAKGFNRPLPVGGTMAIEPKVVYLEGSIGLEDTWIRDSKGLKSMTSVEPNEERYIVEV
jgi:Xaa-Pro aminopeptidase